MDRIKAAVLFDCDERQREELEAAGKDMVEFVYVPEDMSREERLPMLKRRRLSLDSRDFERSLSVKISTGFR